MIESISITNRAPFVGEQSHTAEARKLNFIFGANGVGKTTISRIIDRPDDYPQAQLRWTGGRRLDTLVLNRDFVDHNFGQLKGIFTLGEEQKDTRKRIEQTKSELDAEQNTRARLRENLSGEDGNGGKQAELDTLEETFRDTCWDKTRQYKTVFKDALVRTLNDKKKFKKKLLAEYQSNAAALQPYDELVTRAKILFGEPPEMVSDVPSIHASDLPAHESNPILGKSVIGKRDVDIAAMIEKLGNSDWVKQGRAYYDNNNGICPFCQQTTEKAFFDSLEAYFDETFEADKRVIDELVSSYETDAVAVQQQVNGILDTPGLFVDADKLEAQKKVLDGLVRENLQKLRDKQASPSQQIELRSLAEVVGEIKSLIGDAQTSVHAHNRTVREYKTELEALKAEVWRYVLHELDSDLKAYACDKGALSKAIESMSAGIIEADKKIADKKRVIRELERQTTNIHSTVDEINSILAQFGFTSFHLAVSADGLFYRLERHNGEPAADTLSEGEKTFVVFLYFFNLLGGSQSETDINTDRVVVFDDPVSSLDSDVLFIVSSLIRDVCKDVCQGNGNIKQVFVLTHNVYFHREVTYRTPHDEIKKRDEVFWLVRKQVSGSIIEEPPENPIKTSYELLWNEVREADPANPGLGNTMRRILEYYFKVIGDTKLYDLHKEFEGADKLLCHSLLSWANAGSHHILEPDLHVPSDKEVQGYLEVFKQIFVKHGHEGHYRMMMKLGPSAGSGNVVDAGAAEEPSVSFL